MDCSSEEAQKNGDLENCANGCDLNSKGEGEGITEGEGGGALERTVPEIPEELVEKIIARMPFPSLFKAATLSKAWQSKLSLPSSRVRPSSLFFQEQVAAVSSRWPIYRPVYVDTNGIVGFDRGTHQWKPIIPLSYQWKPMIPLSYLAASDLQFATFTGALMSVIMEDSHGGDIEIWNIFVTNVITKRYRKLPQPPTSVQLGRMLTPEDHVTILPSEARGYRVLVLHASIADPNEMHVRIYDSKLQAWTVREPRVLHSRGFCLQSAYLNEKVYLICDPDFQGVLLLWVYDVCGNSWTRIPQSLAIEGAINGAVLRCGNKVMVAVSRATNNCVANADSMVIYELLPSSLHLKYVGTSPQNQDSDIWDLDLEYSAFCFASDADFLYFRQAFPAHAVATFNVHTHEWSSLPPVQYSFLSTKHMAHGAFEPGMNPFMDV